VVKNLLVFGFLICLLYSSEFGGVNGFVNDATNGEKLVYVNVVIENTQLGASTDEKGYYFIQKIPEGTYQITFSYIGYETVQKIVNILPGKTLTINVELNPTPIELEKVVVTADRERFEKGVEVSHITFTTQEIKSVPTLFEADLIKSLQLMPGIVSMHDLSNKLYVRGGSPDENLVLLDGIIIYNPTTHLFGLFSTFNPDAMSMAELYAGGFPAKYGDRLSAVLDITTKEGNSKRYQGEVGAGLITTKFLIEGPIPKGSLLFSGRRTYFDALVWSYSHIFNKDVSLPYYFYDGVAKINYNPSLDNRFTFTGFGGADILSFTEGLSTSSEKISLSWGNRGISGRWRRVFNPQIYGEMLGVCSNFFTHFWYENFTDTTQNIKLIEEITSISAKADFTYLLNENHTTEFGIQEENLKMEQSWEVVEGLFGPPLQYSNLIGIYLQDKWVLMPPIFYLQLGIRGLYYNQGNRLIYNPRLGLKYRYGENLAFNFSAGKYSQFLITLNSQESYFSIFDFWRPIDKTHSPPVSYHLIGGIERWFGEDANFTFETYYKKYYNLLIPKEEDIFFSTPTESLKVGTGYATGIDLFFKKRFKDISGWISYSFAWTRRNVDDESYYPRYDRRHNINITLGSIIPNLVPILKGGRIDLHWYLGSGLPYADMIARYQYYFFSDNQETPYEWEREWHYLSGPRDFYRLPVSHCLDIHYEKGMKFFGLAGNWYLDIINLYARKNIAFYIYELYDENGDPSEIPRKVGYSILPIPVPSFGINIKF